VETTNGGGTLPGVSSAGTKPTRGPQRGRTVLAEGGTRRTASGCINGFDVLRPLDRIFG
jgi:hypothetical protein